MELTLPMVTGQSMHAMDVAYINWQSCVTARQSQV